MLKNTVIDLWHQLEDTPFIERPDCEQILDAPDGFLGFPYGTTKGEIWNWFDRVYQPWGGLEALMDDPQPERKFQVKTPAGIIECYAKHEIDSDADYPGVFVDIRRTPDQLSGKEIGDVAACVEYDSGSGHLQTCVYQMFRDEPVDVEVYEPLMTYGQFMEKYGSEIVSLEVYNDNGEEIPDKVHVSNTGIHRTHMDGLWTESAFRELIASEAPGSWESALALEGIPIRISTSHLAEVLKKHVAESHLRELYRPEFLDGMEFEPILAVIHKNEPDTVTTIHDYAEDSRLASALCHIFPDHIIHCEWFIDGLGEGGEYELFEEKVRNRRNE